MCWVSWHSYEINQGYLRGLMETPKSLKLIPKYEADSSWWEHVPIAHFLIEKIKPSVVVELGTHYGVSFFSFCEAAEEFSPDTYIYAIDTWSGDPQAGFYNETVFDQVSSYRDKYHKQRSQLIRALFDDACDLFQDNSIDLIHIDGLHTYEAVKHDYENWITKVKDGGTLLFHDWNVKEEGYGVWKLWDEIKKDDRFSCLEVPNGYGLGIATLGNEKPEWQITLKDNLDILKGKGILLDRLWELKSTLTNQSKNMNTMQKHIENLEVMNKDKQEQIDRADQAAKGMKGWRKR